jgi:sugar lactone lactonase YvrE
MIRRLAGLLAVAPLLVACGVTERLLGGPDDVGPQAPVVVVTPAPEGIRILARSPAQPLLLESVAFDSQGRLLVSSIHAAGVFRLDLDGTLTRFTRTGDTRGVFGMISDRERGHLWITSTNTPYDQIEGEGGSALMRLDLTSGEVQAAYGLPEAGHQLSDLVLGPDGTVFVSDSTGGGIYMLSPGSGRLEHLVDAPQRASPQGLVVSDDGRWLIFSNYGTGLHRVVVSTGAIQSVQLPEGRTIRGLDGLARDGNRIIAVHNGSPPGRVLALTLSPDWTQVRTIETLFDGTPLSEPTTGFVSGDSFVFMARSQWSDFGQDGQPTTTTPDPALIGSINLSETHP